jgi:hypothetical protein
MVKIYSKEKKKFIDTVGVFNNNWKDIVVRKNANYGFEEWVIYKSNHYSS